MAGLIPRFYVSAFDLCLQKWSKAVGAKGTFKGVVLRVETPSSTPPPCTVHTISRRCSV